MVIFDKSSLSDESIDSEINSYFQLCQKFKLPEAHPQKLYTEKSLD